MEILVIECEEGFSIDLLFLNFFEGLICNLISQLLHEVHAEFLFVHLPHTITVSRCSVTQLRIICGKKIKNKYRVYNLSNQSKSNQLVNA